MFWPQWWVFIILAVSVFVACMLLNYIVNKMNEVQLEERLVALQLKSPAGRVTQVQAPLLETGETVRVASPTFPLAAINSDLEREIKRVKETYTYPSDVEVVKSPPKPIFLGSIYRSIELIGTPTSNGNIVRTEGNQSESYYCDDILNDLLDRTMEKISDINTQTAPVLISPENRNNVVLMSQVCIPNTRNRNENVINENIFIKELLDNVWKKINK